MTTYVAAYDTEHEECLEALRRIAPVHEKHDMPGTFFLVARLMDKQADEYRALIGDHPLFEIACHSWTHMLLRDHRVCGKAGPPEAYEREIVHSKERLEDVFGCEIKGFRAPVSFSEGFCGAPDLLGLLSKGGYGYSSSLAWGPDDSMPALLREPFTYAEDGFPELWEIPPCGWHDNVLKGITGLGMRRVQLFPHPMPEAAALRPIETPLEDFEMGRAFIDKAIETNAGHVSLVWHPWSTARFDPGMEALDMLFSYVRERGIAKATMDEYVKSLAGERPPLEGE